MALKNYIVKDSKYTFIPGSPGTPSSPGTPYRPAYCAWVDVQVTAQKWQCSNGQLYDSIPGAVQLYSTGLEAGSSGRASEYYDWNGLVCQLTTVSMTEKVRVCYPAVPGVAPTPGTPSTPAQYLDDQNLGWNAGAYSAAQLVGSGRFVAIPLPSVGIVYGLTDTSEVFGEDYERIDFAFHIQQTSFRVVENGVARTTFQAFTPGAEFAIVRSGTTVVYTVGGNAVYTSRNKPQTNVLTADLSMYAAGDKLDDAELLGGNDTTMSVVATAITGGFVHPALQLKSTGSTKAGTYALADTLRSAKTLIEMGAQATARAGGGAGLIRILNLGLPPLTTVNNAPYAAWVAQTNTRLPALGALDIGEYARLGLEVLTVNGGTLAQIATDLEIPLATLKLLSLSELATAIGGPISTINGLPSTSFTAAALAAAPSLAGPLTANMPLATLQYLTGIQITALEGASLADVADDMGRTVEELALLSLDQIASEYTGVIDAVTSINEGSVEDYLALYTPSVSAVSDLSIKDMGSFFGATVTAINQVPFSYLVSNSGVPLNELYDMTLLQAYRLTQSGRARATTTVMPDFGSSVLMGVRASAGASASAGIQSKIRKTVASAVARTAVFMNNVLNAKTFVSMLSEAKAVARIAGAPTIYVLMTATAGAAASTTVDTDHFRFARSETSLAPMTSVGSDKDYTSSSTSLREMTSYSSDRQLFIPQSAVAHTAMVPLSGYAHGLTGEISVSSDMSLRELRSLSADHAYGESTTALQPLGSFGGETVQFNGIMARIFSGWELQASGFLETPGYLRGRFPALLGSGASGVYFKQSIPSLTLQASATVASIGTLTGNIPALTTDSRAHVGGTGTLRASIPRLTLSTASAGEGLTKTIPRLTVSASGVAVIWGGLDKAIPLPMLTSTATLSETGKLEGSLPVLVMTEASHASFVTPLISLDARATTVVTGDVSRVLTVNISTGAVSELSNFAFDAIGYLEGRQLLASSQGVYVYGADTDDGVGITASFTLAPGDNRSPRLKRMPYAYVNGDGDGALKVAQVTAVGDGNPQVSDNVKHVGYGTRRVKLSRGTKSRYFGLYVESVGPNFTVQGVELITQLSERRR